MPYENSFQQIYVFSNYKKQQLHCFTLLPLKKFEHGMVKK